MYLDLPPIDLSSVGSIALYIVIGFAICAFYIRHRNKKKENLEIQKGKIKDQFITEIRTLSAEVELLESENDYLKGKSDSYKQGPVIKVRRKRKINLD